MKKLSGMLVVVLFAGANAFGGTVSFENPLAPSASDPNALELLPGGSGTFDVWIRDTVNNPFSSADIIFASENLLFDSGAWTFGPDFIAGTFTQNTARTDQLSAIAEEFKVGGAGFGNTMSTPIMIGTLTVMAPIDLAPGTYSIFVDNAQEANGVSKIGAVGSPVDPLSGAATVFVTPEPASLILLGTGALLLLRRRRLA